MPTIPGGAEWLIILLIFVLLFGAKKLPELSRSVGQSISSFKQGVREAGEEDADATGADSSAGAEASGGQAQAPREGADDDSRLDEEPRNRGNA